MTGPAYPAARAVAATVQAALARGLAAARERGEPNLAPEPDTGVIEAIIDAAFWASLRREEGSPPKISLAFLPPQQAGQALTFERRLPLAAGPLTRLAPAVERPGIHLGVWRDGDGLHVWGTTRTLPGFCFVLEVVEPGLLVVKYRRGRESAKFGNLAVLLGDQIKLVDERVDGDPLRAPDSPFSWADPLNVLVQLSVSMRAHGRGGALLVVPAGTLSWCESMVRPIGYSVSPPMSELADLVRLAEDERSRPSWQEALRRSVDAVAGLTAVDGATVITDRYELLAFGAKIGRPAGSDPVDQIVVAEPVVGSRPVVMHPSQLGGTRHLSAAQFVHDQRDALALVASQDGRFTELAWSARDGMVRAHRIEALLL